jgi:hypothetical protein
MSREACICVRGGAFSRYRGETDARIVPRAAVAFAFCLTTIAICLTAFPVLAQDRTPVLPGLVERGQKVEVLDDQGRETTGRISLVSADSVSIVSGDRLTQIGVDHITRIARPHDGLANGALIGLAVGAGLGLAAAVSDDCDPVAFGCGQGSRFAFGSALVGGALGTAVGVGIDALIRRDRVIYQRAGQLQTRIAPVVGTRVRGALVAVSW